MIKKLVFQVSYHGGFTSGWQEQEDTQSIAYFIKEALYQLTNTRPGLACAGRTDKGVHATGQVFSFETDLRRDEYKWITGLNHFLPPFIKVQRMIVKDSTFHPRFHAVARKYRYYLYHGHAVHLNGLVTSIWKDLNFEILEKTAQLIEGTHDFSAFRGGSCQAKSPIKHCKSAVWSKKGKLYCFEIEANAFLHHMVRFLVGCQLEVGYGHRSLDWFADLIAKKTKQHDCAPPDGLYLCHATYPAEFNIPFEDTRPWFDSRA